MGLRLTESAWPKRRLPVEAHPDSSGGHKGRRARHDGDGTVSRAEEEVGWAWKRHGKHGGGRRGKRKLPRAR